MRFSTFLAGLFLAALAVLLSEGTAQAEVRAFSAGSLIIPMDSCYQPAQDTMRPQNCPLSGEGTDGPIKAYGLVYMLLKRGITVYVATDPDKTDIAAEDFSITHAGGGAPPVGLYDRASRRAQDFINRHNISYLGSPFVIDVSDAPIVLDLLARDPTVSTFTSVNIHVAYDNFEAPIGMRMNGVPERIAVYVPPPGQGGSSGTEGIPLMRAYLRRAGLDYPNAQGIPSAPGEIYDIVTPADVTGGAMAARYRVVWLPHYDFRAGEQSVMDAFSAFADRGGMIFAECSSVWSFENNSATRFMTTGGITINRLAVCYPGNRPGFNRRGVNPGNWYGMCWDPRHPVQTTEGSALEFEFPTDPIVQIGDFQFFKASGAVEDWVPSAGSAWRPTVKHLLTSRVLGNNQVRRDIVSVIHKDGNPQKGKIIYYGGHFYGDASGPATAGIRIVLNTLLFARPGFAGEFVARSGPTMVTVGGRTLLIQGMYQESNATVPAYRVASDALTWPYPQILGKFAAFDVSQLGSGARTLSSQTGLVFDGSTLIPGAATRRLYTHTGTGSQPRLVPLDRNGIAQLPNNPFGLPGGHQSEDTLALVDKLRGARLGGIDHSQSAVAGPQSIIAGGATRPTVAYVVGLDGMLHAFVVHGSGHTPGAELWAYLPAELLPAVRSNAAIFDGSPNLGDTFELINGVRRWRTLLTVPQGRGGNLVYGLDVSNPLNPELLWVRGDRASGVELARASGSALTIHPTASNPFQSFVLVASANPIGSSGITVSGLSGADGRLLWQWSNRYTRNLPGTPAVVPNDMPAPVAIGGTGERYQNRVYVADLEGRIWELDTATGRNVNGTAPLADVGLTPGGKTQPIGVPPTLYIDRNTGHRALVVVTGGMDWADAADTYGVYAFDLDPSVRRMNQSSGVAPLLFHLPLPAGQKGHAPPAVSGNDLYFIASTGLLSGSIAASLGDAGALYRMNLSTARITSTQTLTKGAGAFLTAQGGTIYGSTARDLVVTSSAGADTSGQSLNQSASSPIRQRVFLESIQ